MFGATCLGFNGRHSGLNDSKGFILPPNWQRTPQACVYYCTVSVNLHAAALMLVFQLSPVASSWGSGFLFPVLCPVFAMCLHVCVFADYKRGFGGKYGVEVEKQDQCALGYDHKESLAKHESQQGISLRPLSSPSPFAVLSLCLDTPTLWRTDVQACEYKWSTLIMLSDRCAWSTRAELRVIRSDHMPSFLTDLKCMWWQRFSE